MKLDCEDLAFVHSKDCALGHQLLRYDEHYSMSKKGTSCVCLARILAENTIKHVVPRALRVCESEQVLGAGELMHFRSLKWPPLKGII